jgi:hypothetical protein
MDNARYRKSLRIREKEFLAPPFAFLVRVAKGGTPHIPGFPNSSCLGSAGVSRANEIDPGKLELLAQVHHLNQEIEVGGDDLRICGRSERSLRRRMDRLGRIPSLDTLVERSFRPIHKSDLFPGGNRSPRADSSLRTVGEVRPASDKEDGRPPADQRMSQIRTDHSGRPGDNRSDQSPNPLRF